MTKQQQEAAIQVLRNADEVGRGKYFHPDGRTPCCAVGHLMKAAGRVLGDGIDETLEEVYHIGNHFHNLIIQTNDQYVFSASQRKQAVIDLIASFPIED